MSYKKLYQELRKKVLKDFGKKCPDLDITCSKCQAWQAVDWVKQAAKDDL